MNPSRRSGFALLAACLAFVIAPCLSPSPAQAQEKGALFINITNEDPWKVSMAAFFGTQFALKQGHGPVVLFVNVQATPMFRKDRAGVRAEQFGKTVHEMLAEFRAAGGKIQVCPVCIKALGIPATELVEGAEVASVKSVNDVLFRPDTKTLSW